MLRCTTRTLLLAARQGGRFLFDIRYVVVHPCCIKNDDSFKREAEKFRDQAEAVKAEREEDRKQHAEAMQAKDEQHQNQLEKKQNEYTVELNRLREEREKDVGRIRLLNKTLHLRCTCTWMIWSLCKGGKADSHHCGSDLIIRKVIDCPLPGSEVADRIEGSKRELQNQRGSS